MSDVTTYSNVSPFDALRRVDETGEHWSARDLMTPLGYVKWERFESPQARDRCCAVLLRDQDA